MYFESVGELWRMLLAVNVLHARSERLSALKQAKAFIRRNRN